MNQMEVILILHTSLIKERKKNQIENLTWRKLPEGRLVVSDSMLGINSYL